jgi:ABC-type Mn2+/Zn2+ transport system permease subunit
VSFLLDLPSGPAIVLLGVALLLVVKLTRNFIQASKT